MWHGSAPWVGSVWVICLYVGDVTFKSITSRAGESCVSLTARRSSWEGMYFKKLGLRMFGITRRVPKVFEDSLYEINGMESLYDPTKNSIGGYVWVVFVVSDAPVVGVVDVLEVSIFLMGYVWFNKCARNCMLIAYLLGGGGPLLNWEGFLSVFLLGNEGKREGQ